MSSLRPLLAFIICAAILIGWVLLFPPAPPPAPQPPPAGAPAEPPQAPVAEKPPEAAPAREQAPEAQLPEEKATLAVSGGKDGSNRLELDLTSRGGGIAETRLPEYKSRDFRGSLVLFPHVEGEPLALGLWTGAVRFEKEKDRDILNWHLEAKEAAHAASFTHEGTDGLLVSKEIQATPGSHYLDFTLAFENRSSEARKFNYRLRGPLDLTSEALRGPGQDLNFIYGERGADGETVISVTPVHGIKVPELESAQDRIVLIGASNNYFAAVLASADAQTAGQLKSGFAEILSDPLQRRGLAQKEFGRSWDELDAGRRQEIEKKVYKNVRTGLRSRDLTLAPGARVVHRFKVFLGPRDPQVLSEVPGLNLTEINYYGWWTLLVKLFLKVLRVLHFILFGSWGLAIIGLTFLVRLCLHPLNRRQQASMMRYQKKMNTVKPELDRIKERYGSNRLKMNQEMQKVLKEHGINPAQMMGGCLMIFFQLPVWYALYSSIEVSLDLRQAPFLWIRDLTQPDRLLTLPVAIPLLGNEINLLPFIYVVLTILQQKMQPKPTDPQMQQQMRMMSFMMIFFGYLFYSFPAGFLLYFIASAAIGMLESKIIKRALGREGLGPSAVAGAGPAPGTGPMAGSSALYPARNPREPRRKKT